MNRILFTAAIILLTVPLAATAGDPIPAGLRCGGICLTCSGMIHQHGPLYNYGPYYGYPPFEPYGPWNQYLQYGSFSSYGASYGGTTVQPGASSACPTCQQSAAANTQRVVWPQLPGAGGYAGYYYNPYYQTPAYYPQQVPQQNSVPVVPVQYRR